MTATSLLILLIIGAIVGWLAGVIVRGFGFGLIGNIVVGIIGALLAGWLLPALGIGFTLGNPLFTSIVYALIGAIVLLVIIGLFRRAPRI
ncbi:MAG: GlsB/YeaQ/YmgE family stress response membrane protein [Rhodanobacter sp.]